MHARGSIIDQVNVENKQFQKKLLEFFIFSYNGAQL
jgi:hypothetical protein